MFSLDDYDYALPEELIAQKPVARREASRLLTIRRDTGRFCHRRFYDLYDRLTPQDVLVVNNTAVIPGRLLGRKASGGKAEVLILDYGHGTQEPAARGLRSYHCLIKASKRPRPGSTIHFAPDLCARVQSVCNDIYLLDFICEGDFEKVLQRVGRVPLPPYIKRGIADAEDRASYQTVYATRQGAIAAPTAGLHFSRPFLERLQSRGVRIVEITLHVGYGTFLPVRVSDIRQHRMHSERFSIPDAAAKAINQAKAGGCRIIAVGTTCVRTLEFAAGGQGEIAAGGGNCDLFIYPGYRFKMVDAMITNFHLPRSTLLMLVSAFAGRSLILSAYRAAIAERYRFYSYGDAMLIE